jgi:hypothetical protein
METTTGDKFSFLEKRSQYFTQCCGSGMFIPDPGSDFIPFQIRIKEVKYLTQ